MPNRGSASAWTCSRYEVTPVRVDISGPLCPTMSMHSPDSTAEVHPPGLDDSRIYTTSVDATRSVGPSPYTASGGREGMIPSRTLRQRGNKRSTLADRCPLLPLQGVRGESFPPAAGGLLSFPFASTAIVNRP